MMSPADIAAHNKQTEELWQAFGRAENTRVPIIQCCDETLWLHIVGHNFHEFYTDPAIQLKTQLVGTSWFNSNIVHDQRMGAPADNWTLAPRWWMDEAEFFGCDVTIQQNSFSWAVPLNCSKSDILAKITDINPDERIQAGRLWHLYQDMSELAAEMIFEDLPVKIISPGGGTQGIFTVACNVRGPEALCLDLLEDPDFAYEYLALITEKTIARIITWGELTGVDLKLPNDTGWGMCDDSLQLISANTYKAQVLPHHQNIYSAMTTGHRNLHLCGLASQHFHILYEELGIRTLDGPGPFVDFGQLLADMPELKLNAQADHSVLMIGPASAIDDMMRNALTNEAKIPGRIHMLGYITPVTPLEHVTAMYDAGKRYGIINK